MAFDAFGQSYTGGMDTFLNMIRPDGSRTEFEITKQEVILGRSRKCDFKISVSDISREHCRLERRGNSWFLSDLGSSNGTYCNKEKIDQERHVQPGDIIVIGKVVFTLSIRGLTNEELPSPLAVNEPIEEADDLADTVKIEPESDVN